MILGLLCILLGQQPASPVKKADVVKPSTPAVKTEVPTPRPDGVYAVFDIVQGADPKTATPVGKIVCKLYEKESPVTVANFIGLATGTKLWPDPKTRQKVKRPLYNGLTFHRVIPGFMIQGGDPLGSGMGGTDTIPDEFDLGLKFDREGVLAMANAGPDTGSSQFFITDGPTPHLNGRHTIFGQVVEGQEFVEQIARVPRDSKDKPREAVIMRTVKIERWPPPPPAVKPKPAAAKPKPAATKPATTPATPKPPAAKPVPAPAKKT
jgi:peptidyl-prolyl cis-trans isomerase A (cyclophilin A)